MRSIVSELLRQDRLTIFESFSTDSPKTRLLAEKLKEFGGRSALIIIDSDDRNLALAARNIPAVDVVEAKQVDPVSLINFDRILATKAAMQQLETRLS